MSLRRVVILGSQITAACTAGCLVGILVAIVATAAMSSCTPQWMRDYEESIRHAAPRDTTGLHSDSDTVMVNMLLFIPAHRLIQDAPGEPWQVEYLPDVSDWTLPPLPRQASRINSRGGQAAISGGVVAADNRVQCAPGGSVGTGAARFSGFSGLVEDYPGRGR